MVQGFWCAPRAMNVDPGGSSTTTRAAFPSPRLSHRSLSLPLLEPPSEIKPPLEGEALLRWIPCRAGSHAHRASFLLQITSAAETEAVTSQKLVKGHAYSVTGAEEVRSPPRRGETQPALCVA